MSSKKTAVCLLTVLVGALTACRTSQGKRSQVNQVEAVPPQALDVNDVSILFPLPDSLADISKLLPIDFSNEQGVKPMSPALFKELIAQHDQAIVVEGKQTRLKSGSIFREQGSLGPFDKIEDWKIVAMRYDPCASGVEHNLRKKPPQSAPTAFDPKQCTPQIRLTAQPVMDGGRALFRRKGKVNVADYAIHMLFTLNPEESAALYKDLGIFKRECGDVTSSVPLGMHPCLIIEKRQGTFAGPRFQRVQGLIKKYALRYTGTAMLATKMDNDPWSFMNGLIVDGKFKHLSIDAVREDDPKKINRNSKGDMLEPFANGFFQMLSFLDVGGSEDEGGPRSIAPIRVTPITRIEKTNASLLEEFDSLKIDEPAYFPKLNAIDNPLHNDFFSTDCVSCHGATDVFNSGKVKASGEGKGLKASEMIGEITSFTFKSRDIFDLEKDSNVLRQKADNFFRLENGYTNIVDPFQEAFHRGNDGVYGLIHFGYLESRASISFRTANESALVAKIANNFYGNGITSRASCATEELRQCLTSNPIDKMSDDDFRLPRYGPLGYCMQKVCPKRAQELSVLIGKDSPGIYRIREDIRIGSDPYADADAGSWLKKGSTLKGWIIGEGDRWEFLFAEPSPGKLFRGDLDVFVFAHDLQRLARKPWTDQLELLPQP